MKKEEEKESKEETGKNTQARDHVIPGTKAFFLGLFQNILGKKNGPCG